MKTSLNSIKTNPILDLLLLSFGLIIPVAVITGALASRLGRRRRRRAEPATNGGEACNLAANRSQNRIPKDPGTFKGILVNYPGPVRRVDPVFPISF